MIGLQWLRMRMCLPRASKIITILKPLNDLAWLLLGQFNNIVNVQHT